MKRRLAQTLLFSAIVCSSTFHSSPVMGESIDIKTGVAVQEETTSLAAGISNVMVEYLNEEYEKVTVESIFDSEEWHTGWTTTNVNVRNEPSIASGVLEVYSFNTPIQYYKFNDEWAKIVYPTGYAYMSLQYISNEKLNYRDYTVPITSGFKSYMPYTAITNKASKQFKLQQMASDGTYGIRTVNNRYCVAIGTAFNAQVGTYFDMILANETVISCIVSDIKADKHTDKNNMITVSNGCLTEFIVNSNILDRNAKRMGDISYCCDEWNSRVEKIRVYDKNIFEKGE